MWKYLSLCLCTMMLSYVVSAEPFSDRSRAMLCKRAQMGSQHQTMNHILNMCTLTEFEGGLNLPTK